MNSASADCFERNGSTKSDLSVPGDELLYLSVHLQRGRTASGPVAKRLGRAIVTAVVDAETRLSAGWQALPIARRGDHPRSQHAVPEKLLHRSNAVCATPTISLA